jgi:hypothetical protein
MTEQRPKLMVERAPALAAYGDLGRRVARMVRGRPDLAHRLLCAPRRAVHAYGAFLQPRA